MSKYCKHEWEVTGRSPVLDEVWKNCKKCKMPKEDYDSENPQQFSITYDNFKPGHIYIDGSQILWKVEIGFTARKYSFKRPNEEKWTPAPWAHYGSWIKAMKYDEVRD